MRFQRTGFRTSAITYTGVLLICVGLPNSTALAASYSTNFPKAEPLISENGHWVTAGTSGVDWHATPAGFKGILHVSSVSTMPGYAFGPNSPERFGDSLAVLTGTWGPDQEASATVRQIKPFDHPEVEIRLRTSLKNATGYEIMWSALGHQGKPYLAIATWDGPGSKAPHYTILKTLEGPQYGVATGDVVKARIVGNTITAYTNGKLQFQITDNTFAKGNPGIGFNEGPNGTYGYSSFSASDVSPETSSAGSSVVPGIDVGASMDSGRSTANQNVMVGDAGGRSSLAVLNGLLFAREARGNVYGEEGLIFDRKHLSEQTIAYSIHRAVQVHSGVAVSYPDFDLDTNLHRC